MKHTQNRRLLVKNALHTLYAKTLHGICSGVSETENEVAGRIRFLALFQKPKTLVLGLCLVAIGGVAVFCLGGNNPVATLPQTTPDATNNINAQTAGQTSTTTNTAALLSWQADLTHNGQTETIYIDTTALTNHDAAHLYWQQADDASPSTDAPLWQLSSPYSQNTSGQVAYFIYHDNTGDYLLCYKQSRYTAGYFGSYSYTLFYLSETGDTILQDENSCFIYAYALDEAQFGQSYTPETNPETVMAFYETLTSYLSQSYLLASTITPASYQSADGTILSQTSNCISGTAEAPITMVPDLIDPAVFATQTLDLPQDNASDRLRAQLTIITQTATESNQLLLAAHQQENEQAMAEIGMTAPFTALPTYAQKVLQSQSAPDAAVYGNSFYMTSDGATRADELGNQISYRLSVTTAQNEAPTDQYNSWLLPNEVYWNGTYWGDAPNAQDMSYYDFYSYDFFMIMLDLAQYLPEGSNLQLTVDSTADGNHKKIASVSYALYSPNGTVLETTTLDNTTSNGTVLLQIPTLNYHQQDRLLIQYTIILTDDTTPETQDKLVFSLPCTKVA